MSLLRNRSSFARAGALALLVILGSACKQPSSESAAGTPPAMSTTPSSGSTNASAFVQATFDVKGMTCASCNVAVKVAAEKVPGVRAARAGHDEQRAWVTYDPARTSPSAIAAAITEAGYEAKPLPSTGLPGGSSN